jgi:hypothetical protein
MSQEFLVEPDLLSYKDFVTHSGPLQRDRHGALQILTSPDALEHMWRRVKADKRMQQIARYEPPQFLEQAETHVKNLLVAYLSSLEIRGPYLSPFALNKYTSEAVDEACDKMMYAHNTRKRHRVSLRTLLPKDKADNAAMMAMGIRPAVRRHPEPFPLPLFQSRRPGEEAHMINRGFRMPNT